MENLPTNYNELTIKKQTDLINLIISKKFEIDAMKAEENKLKLARMQLEKQLDLFEERIKNAMLDNGIEKIENDAGKLDIRKCPISVEIENIDAIPNEFVISKLQVIPDKKKIAKHFKDTGEIIDGVKINYNNTTLEIK